MRTRPEGWDLMSYRERAEANLKFYDRDYKIDWQPLATAAVWALLAIAQALERLTRQDIR